jgi:hypothetical protein
MLLDELYCLVLKEFHALLLNLWHSGQKCKHDMFLVLMHIVQCFDDAEHRSK